jgi:hypothetical protein
VERSLLERDPAGRFAVRATRRSVEVWIVQAIAFERSFRPAPELDGF